MKIGLTNRRQFLAGSVAGALCLTSIPVLASSQVTAPDRRSLAEFVFDDRFEYGTEMALGLDPNATRIHAIRGDVADVWYSSLAPSLQANPRPIGGLTTAGGFFVLSRLGHDAGLTLAMRGRHRLLEDGRKVEHALAATPQVARRFISAVGIGMPWTSAVLAGLQEVASRPSSDRIAPPLIGVSEVFREPTLYSWLLTPRV